MTKKIRSKSIEPKDQDLEKRKINNKKNLYYI